MKNQPLEIINPHLERGKIRFALFDFDGTLSLIREGWQGVMIPMMVEILRQTPRAESEPDLYAVVTDYIGQLTGKQTIYQMIRLGQEVEKRGGRPAEPLTYKRLYLDRLWSRIEGRVTDLKTGKLSPEAMMVPGSRSLLHALRQRNVTCYMASGTDEPYVIDEAAALGLTSFFAGIYGALDNYQSSSKRIIIEQLMTKNHLTGSELVVFGDGYVEIEEAKRVNGLAIGVASNEATRTGIDTWKRTRLLQAGADIIVADYHQYQKLVNYLFNK